jgi:hypothetical protein
MVSERPSFDRLLDPECFPTYRGCGAKGCVLALEDPGGLRLDLLSDQRVQSVPGGQIDFNAHALLKQPLGGYQIKRVELATRAIVEKEVKITCASGLVTSRRAKQIKRCSSTLLQRTREGPKFLDGVSSFHVPNPTRTYGEQQKRILVD